MFLTKLLKKSTPFSWKSGYNLQLETIFREIKEQHSLKYPDYNKTFSLFSNASEVGAGSILKQQNAIISFYSCKWNNCELSYTIIEKAVGAIKKSTQHFHSILFGCKLEVFTDNDDSLYQQPLTKRVQR